MNALFGEEKNVPFEKKYQIEIDLIRSPRWDNIGCENFLIKNSIDIRFSTYTGSNNTNISSTETGCIGKYSFELNWHGQAGVLSRLLLYSRALCQAIQMHLPILPAALIVLLIDTKSISIRIVYRSTYTRQRLTPFTSQYECRILLFFMVYSSILKC